MLPGVAWHTTAKQVKAGPAVHLTFDQLEPVNVTLNLAVTPR